jgi:predicted CopG family antitoxin
LRTINETFTEKEFQKLQTVKGERTWHDFIMELAKRARRKTEGEVVQ